MVDTAELRSRIEKGIDEGVIPTLMEYIRVPSLSPLFDSNWESNGLMEQAQEILLSYVKSLNIAGFTHEILKEEGRPWLFYGEVQPTTPDLGTLLIYGHMDKQPHFPGWIEGTNNTEPAVIDGKLYGRGGADDGYALPSAALLIKTLQDLNIPHGRIVIIGETEEESGSPNLMYLIDKLKYKIGQPDLIICLDSGAGDYEHLWLTSSLRGVVAVDLTVRIIKNGMHSGDCSGIVPSTFRIIRQLLDRIEDSRTGEILIPELYSELSPSIYEKASSVAKVIGKDLFNKVEWDGNSSPVTTDLVQAILNRTLRPTLSVIGAEGLPPVGVAGNVLRPYTKLKLSIRLPPSVDADTAYEKIHEVLTRDPPYNATVEVSKLGAGNGFSPSELDPWISDALNHASQTYFGSETLYYGEGGSIPFMGMLGNMFPKAKFVVTGVLGPNSNAHSANEFLHIPFLKKILPSLGVLVAAHGQKKNS
jgi:acetylornithine deacetylase/succinyl-diaminopimelate desuccinylase-like protein